MAESSETRHQYLIAVVPFVAYFCALAFEIGRYNYLQIPFSLLELTSERLGQLLFFTVVGALILFIALTHLVALAESESKNRHLLGRALIWGIPIFGFALLLAPDWRNLLMALGMWIVKMTDPYVLPDRAHLYNEELADSEPDRINRRMRRLRSDTVWYLLLIWMSSVLFFRAGELFQQLDTSYVVTFGPENSVVVAKFEGHLITKGYSPEQKRLTPGFRIMPVDNYAFLSLQDIGPLQQE
jgi:hypothetical protein